MPKRKILVVDDEPSIRGLLVSALKTADSEVVEADDGFAALQLAGQHGFFDLVVTDVIMPGMSGIELARRLRTGGNARRFLFVSGCAQINSISRTLEEFERASFLNKPFAIVELLRVVDSLCDEPPAAPVMDPLRRAAGA
jgi:CheY-like chemotaxis protein